LQILQILPYSPKIASKYTLCQYSKKAKKWPNHFIPGQQFLKRTNLADLASKKSKWQPCNIPNPLTHLLEQAWGTSGPRATYGPPSALV